MEQDIYPELVAFFLEMGADSEANAFHHYYVRDNVLYCYEGAQSAMNWHRPLTLDYIHSFYTDYHPIPQRFRHYLRVKEAQRIQHGLHQRI